MGVGFGGCFQDFLRTEDCLIKCFKSQCVHSCIRESGLRAAIGCAFSYINISDIEWIGF